MHGGQGVVDFGEDSVLKSLWIGLGPFWSSGGSVDVMNVWPGRGTGQLRLHMDQIGTAIQFGHWIE